MPWIGAGRNRDRLEEAVLGADARALLGARRDEARAALAARDRGEAGPADAAAPQRRRAGVQHHGGTVARAVEIDRLEILVRVEPEAVEHIAREDDQPGAARPECDGLALEVGDGAVRAVGAHHEHAGGRIHGGDDLQVGGRAPDPGERLVGDLALHQRDVELALFQERHVLGAALGVARLDCERGIGRVYDLGEHAAEQRKPAARGRGAEHHRGLLLRARRLTGHHLCRRDERRPYCDHCDELHDRPLMRTGSPARRCPRC